MENKNKETTAAAKGRIFTKLAKEIMVAARAGADPEMNSASAYDGGSGQEGIHATRIPSSALSRRAPVWWTTG